MIVLKGVVLEGIGLKRSDPQTECSLSIAINERKEEENEQ
jgi:hypothetical protein